MASSQGRPIPASGRCLKRSGGPPKWNTRYTTGCHIRTSGPRNYATNTRGCTLDSKVGVDGADVETPVDDRYPIGPLGARHHRPRRNAPPNIKPYVDRAPSPSPKRYTICAIAGAENCWEVVGTPTR